MVFLVYQVWKTLYNGLIKKNIGFAFWVSNT